MSEAQRINAIVLLCELLAKQENAIINNLTIEKDGEVVYRKQEAAG